VGQIRVLAEQSDFVDNHCVDALDGSGLFRQAGGSTLQEPAVGARYSAGAQNDFVQTIGPDAVALQ
jgi:hypothetical protein